MAKKASGGGGGQLPDMPGVRGAADGPVTYAEVKAWFGPHMPSPSTQTLTGLCNNVNHYQKLFPRRDAKIRAMNSNLSRMRSFRVNEALQILINDLPHILSDLEKTISSTPDDEEYYAALAVERNAIVPLLSAAQKTSEFFKQYKAKSRGRTPEWWHQILSRLFEVIAVDWKGRNKPPAKQVLAGFFNVALTRIGFNLTDAVILKALQKIGK